MLESKGKFVVYLLFIVGLILFGLNIASLVIDPAKNSNAVSILDKNEVYQTLHDIAKLTQNPFRDDDIARQVSNVFHAAITHYWSENDPTLGLPWWRNWLLFSTLKMVTDLYSSFPYQPQGKTASLMKQILSSFEYPNYKDALARGVGLCSQNALAVTSFMRSLGFQSMTISLNSHVVNQTTFPDGKQYVIDADYNVVLPYSVDYLRTHANLIKDYYQTNTILMMKIYAHASIPYSEPVFRMVKFIELLSWLIPFFLMLPIGIGFLRNVFKPKVKKVLRDLNFRTLQ